MSDRAFPNPLKCAGGLPKVDDFGAHGNDLRVGDHPDQAHAVVAIRRMRRMAAKNIQRRPAQCRRSSAPLMDKPLRILTELKPSFRFDRDGAGRFCHGPQAQPPVGWDVRQRRDRSERSVVLVCLTFEGNGAQRRIRVFRRRCR